MKSNCVTDRLEQLRKLCAQFRESYFLFRNQPERLQVEKCYWILAKGRLLNSLRGDIRRPEYRGQREQLNRRQIKAQREGVNLWQVSTLQYTQLECATRKWL